MPLRRRALACLSAIAASLLLPVAAQAAVHTITLPRELRARASASETIVVTLDRGVTVAGARPLTRDARVVELPVAAGQTENAIARLTADARVQGAERNVVRRYSAVNDQYFPYQWNLPAIGWTDALVGAPAVEIAIVDSGVDVQHPELAGKVSATYNAIDGSATVIDTVGHGTSVASVAVATTNNGVGFAGVAPGARIAAVKAGGIFGIELADEIRAIDWAVARGVKVINLSFGSPDYSLAEHNVIRRAVAAGAVVVVASGNDGCTARGDRNAVEYPAGYEEAIAVAATAEDSAVTCFSSGGAHVDIAAPGEDIGFAEPVNSYAWASGTSLSAPHVAAAAALVRGKNPGWSGQQARAALLRSARDIGAAGRDDRAGAGLLQLPAALAIAVEHIPDPAYVELRPAAMYEPATVTGGGVAAAAAPLAPRRPRGTNRAEVLIGTAFADVINALGGNDVVYGAAGNDLLVGGKGNDRLLGDAGNDLLYGGPGRDRVGGGPGRDMIDVRDGRGGDIVSCGPGRDRVRADRRDRVLRDCERVTRR